MEYNDLVDMLAKCNELRKEAEEDVRMLTTAMLSAINAIHRGDSDTAYHYLSNALKTLEDDNA